MLHVLVTASFPYVQETVYTYWQQLRSLIHRENNQNKYVLATSYFPCIHALTTAFFPYVHEQIVHILAKASFPYIRGNIVHVLSIAYFLYMQGKSRASLWENFKVANCNHIISFINYFVETFKAAYI